MILTEEVEVITVGKSINHFKKLGYEPSHKKSIKVRVSDLTSGSSCIVNVICDICKKENNIEYSRHYNSSLIYGYYCCQKCKGNKIKKTTIKRYGVDNVSKLQSIKDKKEKTCMENYLVTNPSYSEEILNKIGDSIEKNYGVRHALQNKEILNKMQETIESNYGVKHALQNPNLLEKSKQTHFKNYGVEFSTQSKQLLQKSKETRIKKGIQIPDELKSDWEIYKNIVRIETLKNKNVLFEKWDGCDFYDGEYIKDNFILFSNNRGEYPSIDHKISVHYGFINKIDSSEIGSIENLCITKTKINSSKRNQINYQFIK